jgi:hypothetical protein
MSLNLVTLRSPPLSKKTAKIFPFFIFVPDDSVSRQSADSAANQGDQMFLRKIDQIITTLVTAPFIIIAILLQGTYNIITVLVTVTDIIIKY